MSQFRYRHYARSVMARFALFGTFVLALSYSPFAVAEDKKEVPKELVPFQGSWKIVDATLDGKPAPKDLFAQLAFAFEGEKLTVTEKDKPETGSYMIDSKKDPATIDMINPKGDKALGIYKFDKDGKLTICFNKGKDAMRPKSFDEKDAILLVLEKMKK